jgi:hypothetical protein
MIDLGTLDYYDAYNRILRNSILIVLYDFMTVMHYNLAASLSASH